VGRRFQRDAADRIAIPESHYLPRLSLLLQEEIGRPVKLPHGTRWRRALRRWRPAWRLIGLGRGRRTV
jgi:hypothetical protein